MFGRKNKAMSFTSCNKQGVISEAGFSFYSIDRFHFGYQEGDHTALLIVERGIGVTKIYCEDLAWTYPFENEIIPPQKKDEIIKNIQETDVSPSDFSASPSSSSPHLGQIQFFATVLALPGIGYYLGAMQLGPLLFGKISAEEFAEKWRNLFSMQIGLFLIVLPLIFYILLLTSIWGKFTGKTRKRLLLGSLLTGVLSYIALGAHYGALVNSLGMSLLIGAFVYWLRREG